MPKIDHQELLNFTETLLSTGGMPSDDAKLVANLLVKAELRGYPGHGVTRVDPYLAWIKDGTIRLREKPARSNAKVKLPPSSTGTTTSARSAAHMAIELAIEKAKEHGAGVVTASPRRPHVDGSPTTWRWPPTRA